jgi:hypothetical protein
MNQEARDYSFWGLLSNGERIDTPITTLAYVVAIVDSPQNPAADLEKAQFILSYLFEVEEQVSSAAELLVRQERSFPKGFHPQTPVMLTLRWSPIAALLDYGWHPLALTRESGRMACASGVWSPTTIEAHKSHENCETPEELFWHVISKASSKAKAQGGFLGIIASPGWDFDDDVLQNLSLAEARKAGRVIWQRTPRVR